MNKNRHSKHINLEKRNDKIGGKKSKNPRRKKPEYDSQNEMIVRDERGCIQKPKKQGELTRFLSQFGVDIHRVETPVYSRVLNELSRVARFRNVSLKEGFLTFEASSKQRGEIIALLDNLCYTHNIVGTKGVLNGVLSVLQRAGLVVGMFCVVGAFLVYPHFVFNVEYNGDADKNVQDALAHFGVEEGAFLWHLDEEEVEKHLLALEGISFASVEKVGTRVYVRVAHELPAHTSLDTSGNTIATKDGIVTRIVVYSGTAEVAVGDRVEKGQVLIGDYHLKGEDKIPIEARGEVYIERQVTFERFFPDEAFVETGETETRTVVGLFKESKVPSSPYQYYTTKKTVSKNDFLIPFTVTNWTFYEVALVHNSMSEEEMKDMAYGEVIGNHQFERVIHRTVQIERTEGGYTVKIILTVEEKQ